jgi:hypothetical protein
MNEDPAAAEAPPVQRLPARYAEGAEPTVTAKAKKKGKRSE